jgi:hypothetical protein
MSTLDAQSGSAGSDPVDLKFEVVVIPVKEPPS